MAGETLTLADFKNKKILIAGGPRVGKSTLGLQLSRALAIPVLATDDLIGHLDWSEVSGAVAKWFSNPEAQIIEGVAVSRALRRYLDQCKSCNPYNKPADIIIRLSDPQEYLKIGQRGMTKGELKVWNDIMLPLYSWGMEIYHDPSIVGLPTVGFTDSLVADADYLQSE